MATRRVRDASLETRTARAKLVVRKKPYPGPLLARGIRQDYRRNKGAGTWVAVVANGHGGYWTKALKGVVADDTEDADGVSVLSYWEAQTAIRALARGDTGETGDKPVTVGEALDAYERALRAEGGDPYNARRVRVHLPDSLLGKPVALLSATELRRWRDSLLAKGLKPATINRTARHALGAALEQAAKVDPRIANHRAWKVGLARLPAAETARNVILPDHDVRRLIEASYAVDRQLGVLVLTAAITAARPSQIARLQVRDLQADRADARLLMPLSHKGGDRSKGHQHRSVPITPDLAEVLKQEAAGREPDALLLLRTDGSVWRKASYRRDFRRAAAAAGLDPDIVTLYSMRHSAIVRSLLKGVPIRVVAAAADTSVGQIERNYSKFITDHSDALSRAALLDTSMPPTLADNVMALSRAKAEN
jgi:integrase